MTLPRWLRRASLPGLVALAATVGAGAAFAGTTSTTGITYAVQSVVQTAGAVTIPFPNLFYITGGATAASATAGSFSVQFNLPPGITPVGPVTATVLVSTTCAAQSAFLGTVSGSTISFNNIPTLTTSAAADTCVVILNNLAVTGAGALQAVAGTNTLTYTAQMTSQVNVFFPTADLTASAATSFAISKSGLGFASAAPSTVFTGALVIDVASAGLAKKFKQNGASTLTADLGNLAVSGVPALKQSDGVTAFAIGVGGITITATGNFNNIASAFITPFLTAPSASSPCGSTSGSFPATTITPTTITFAGLSLGTGTNINGELCVVANGTGVIGANSATAPETLTASVATTTQKDTGAPLPYNYNGSVQQILYTGTFPPYLAFMRIVNNSAATANVLVVVQPDGSGVPGASSTPIAVAGNSNQLIPAPTIITASGVTLDSTGRVSMLFLTPGFACVNNGFGPVCPVSVGQFIVSPGGVVTELGSGGAP